MCYADRYIKHVIFINCSRRSCAISSDSAHPPCQFTNFTSLGIFVGPTRNKEVKIMLVVERTNPSSNYLEDSRTRGHTSDELQILELGELEV